jgi:hypothetical protein
MIPSIIVGFYDYKKFYKQDKKATARKAKIIGISFIAVSLVLVILQKII